MNMVTFQSTLKIVLKNGISDSLHNDHFRGKEFINKQLDNNIDKVLIEMNSKIPGKNIHNVDYIYDNKLKITFKADKELTKEDKEKMKITWRSWLEYIDMLILRNDKFHENNGDDYLLMVYSDATEI